MQTLRFIRAQSSARHRAAPGEQPPRPSTNPSTSSSPSATGRRVRRPCALAFAFVALLSTLAHASYQPIALPPANNDTSAARPNTEVSPSLLPPGQTTDHDTPFTIAAPVRLTGLREARQGVFLPPIVTGSTLNRKFGTLHLLHAIDGSDRDGTPIAAVVFHYSDGLRESVRLTYGIHGRDMTPAGERRAAIDDPRSYAIWTTPIPAPGRPPRLRVYHTALANPHPDQTVTRFDMISLFSQSAPVLLAATTEDGPSSTAPAELPENRVVRRSRALADDDYHGTLHVLARDSVGRPVPDAEATLTISDLDGAYFFGRARSDANGRIQLSFPPQQAAGVVVVVRAPQRLPFVFRNPATGLGPADRTITANLITGTTAGGVVQTAAGTPIAGATVVLYHLTATSRREYERLDYDTVTTDAEGRWSSSAAPASLDQFQLAVSHPDFRPKIYGVRDREASAGVASVQPDELRARRALAQLDPAQQIVGTVRDPSGNPVPGAELRLAPARNSSDGDGEDQTARSGADGRFKFSVSAAGAFNLVAQAPNYAPELKLVSVPNRSDATVTESISLRPGRRLVGKVQDQSRQPVPGARVRLETWKNSTRLLKFEAEADERGTFIWPNAPDGPLRFYISATNHSSVTHILSGNETEQIFTLQKSSSARGFVTDAETGKPIPEFSIFRGRAYNPGEPIRWERYNTFRGRNGEYNVRLVEYSSSVRTAILIEAPGYRPAASPEFSRGGLYTNNFALKKERGVFGRIVAPDGTPLPGALANLVEPGEYAYFRNSGDLSRSSDSGPQVRSDARGEFQFPARLDPHTIIATHAKGFAEVRVTNPAAPVLITLQPWAEIHGVVRLPRRGPKARSVQLGNLHYRYTDESRESQPLSIYVSDDTEEDGSFHFNRVPPGDRMISLRYMVQMGDSTRSTTSHQFPLTLAPGQSTNIVLGEGRTIVGRMKVTGGEPEDVDWLRDFHQLSLSRTLQMNVPSIDYSKATTDEERQALWARQRKLQEAYWRSPEGRAWERGNRSYVLEFETNGAFRIDGVPPGSYTLNISPTDPSREDYSYEQIGNFSHEVTVPAGDPARPIDLGEFSIAVRATLRVGKRAPSFAVTNFNGQILSSDQLRGKPVLLEFWASWTGTRASDVRQLKPLYDRFGQNKRLHMVGINFDVQRDLGEAASKTDATPWPQAYGGEWNGSALRASFGLRSLPDAMLIDADGRIAALNYRGSALTRAVERLVADTPTAPGKSPPPKEP